MYIKEADYRTRINSDLLARMTTELNADPAAIFGDVSKTAEDTIGSYAGVLYDIAPEWAKEGTDRNALVKTWALNIATYELYQRIDDEQVPEKVVKNYDDTVEDLQKLATGKFPLALPPRPDESTGGGEENAGTTGAGLRRMGSNRRRSHLP